jgi:hypothetical protein
MKKGQGFAKKYFFADTICPTDEGGDRWSELEADR